MTLSINTPIATSVRGQVRAFIKGQAGFDAWIARRGLESRDALNRDLLDYAIEHKLDEQVEAIMQGAPVPYTTQHIADNAQEDERVEASIMGRQAATPEKIEKGLGLVNELLDPKGAKYPTEEMSPASAKAVLSGVAVILAPVEPFLSPLVRSELEKAIAPLVIAANKPAQTVEVEKIVYQTVNVTPLPVGATPYATPKPEKVTLGSVFGFKGQYSKAPVTLWDSHGAAPAVDPHYVVDPYNMFVLADCIEQGANVWAGGPSGSGKSTLPEQFAAHVGRPCVTFSFTRQTEVADLLGGPAVLAGGSTAWQDGALVQAMKRPGTIIVLDELSIAPAGVQAILHSPCSDARQLLLPTGEIVKCAPGVVFVVADNTFGYGDETGQYHGTNAANAALVNRFAAVMKIDYMSKSDETKALVNRTGAPKPACEALADFVNRARKMPEMENVALSLRQMISFIHRCKSGLTPKQAAQLAFLNRLPSAERAALETLFTLAWANEFSALMSGTALDPNNPSPDGLGPQSPGAKAFDDEVSASLIR